MLSHRNPIFTGDVKAGVLFYCSRFNRIRNSDAMRLKYSEVVILFCPSEAVLTNMFTKSFRSTSLTAFASANSLA